MRRKCWYKSRTELKGRKVRIDLGGLEGRQEVGMKLGGGRKKQGVGKGGGGEGG